MGEAEKALIRRLEAALTLPQVASKDERDDAHSMLRAALAEARETERADVATGDTAGRLAYGDLREAKGRRDAFQEAAEVKFGIRVPSDEEKARMRPQDWVDLGVEATRDAIRQLAGVAAPEPRLSRKVPFEVRALTDERNRKEPADESN